METKATKRNMIIHGNDFVISKHEYQPILVSKGSANDVI